MNTIINSNTCNRTNPRIYSFSDSMRVDNAYEILRRGPYVFVAQVVYDSHASPGVPRIAPSTLVDQVSNYVRYMHEVMREMKVYGSDVPLGGIAMIDTARRKGGQLVVQLGFNDHGVFRVPADVAHERFTKMVVEGWDRNVRDSANPSLGTALHPRKNYGTAETPQANTQYLVDSATTRQHLLHIHRDGVC